MSEQGDQAPRPAWPGAPTAERPAWPEAAPRRRWWRGPIDAKLLIPVLIGLMSVTGAIITWQSSQLGENATDKDRQAIAETVRQQQDDANNEILLQDARGRVAANAAALANAELLDEQSARFDAAGDSETAGDLADQAEEERAVARSYLQTGATSLQLANYVVVDPSTGRRTLDEGALAADLRELSDAQSQVNPTQTVRQANRLRSDSQWLDGWVVPLVCAIALMTFAQISRARFLRLMLGAGGTVVWVVSTILAFGGR